MYETTRNVPRIFSLCMNKELSALAQEPPPLNSKSNFTTSHKPEKLQQNVSVEVYIHSIMNELWFIWQGFIVFKSHYDCINTYYFPTPPTSGFLSAPLPISYF